MNKYILTIIGTILGVFIVVYLVAMFNTSNGNLGGVGASGSFSRATATSTTLVANVASTIFATTTEGVYRAIGNDNAAGIFCSVGESAVWEKGFFVAPSSSVSFCSRSGEGDCDVPTIGTVSCISSVNATGSAIIAQ